VNSVAAGSLTVGALFVVVSTALRSRVGVPAWTVLVAAGGACLGAGALSLVEHVSSVARLLTPPVMAGLAVAHIRALFAGSGPFRT
jgi:hypothetical protein